MEPLITTKLQRRLIEDFGQSITNKWERSELMQKILSHYLEEGQINTSKNEILDKIKSSTEYIDNRHLLRILGYPVSKNIIDKILIELKNWSNSGLKSGATRERTSIQASS